MKPVNSQPGFTPISMYPKLWEASGLPYAELVDELVRLVAQRVACPSLDGELDREIERRLWELDEVDEALSQLSA